MPEKKELNEEELEKITGGEGTLNETRNVVVRYQETVDGMELWTDLGRFPIAQAEAEGETMAKQWCALNNKIYAGWNLANFLTNNYDAQSLLVSLPTKTMSMD